MDSASTCAPWPIFTSAVPATRLVTSAPLPANRPTARLKACESKSWSRWAIRSTRPASTVAFLPMPATVLPTMLRLDRAPAPAIRPPLEADDFW